MIMTEKDFQNYVIEHIKNHLSASFDSAETKVREVSSSGGKYDGLMIRRSSDESLYPVLNLTHAYNQHMRGKDPDKICKELASIRMHEFTIDLSAYDFCDFQKVRERIFPRLTPYSIDLLRDYGTCLFSFGDLAVLFYIKVTINGEDYGETVIDEQLIKVWGISPEELRITALHNIEREEVFFSNLMDVQFSAFSGTQPDELVPENVRASDYPIPLFALSTKSCYGANILLNDKYMSRLVESLGELFVLPSSVNEVVICPVSCGVDVFTLTEMVQTVNREYQNLGSNLSDRVYKYNTHGFCIA